MKSENFGQDMADDGLYVNSNTNVQDVKEFVRKRIDNPIVVNGTVIWDFCGYERDEEALKEAVRIKLEGDRYIIPFQVTGTWGAMFNMLPEHVQDSQILVYDANKGMYKGYTNFEQQISREEKQAFRQDLAKRAIHAEPTPLTFD